MSSPPTYLARTAWRARLARPGPGPLHVDQVDGVALHWPGMADPLDSFTDVAAALRGWQSYHLDDKGWSDIAYQVAVDQAGRAWTLRGLRTKSGANGDAEMNDRYGAILLIVAPGEQPSPALLATTRAVITDFRRLYPGANAIRPHSAVRPEPTDCPGDAIRAAIARGDFTPSPLEDIDMTTAAELKTQLDRVEKVLGTLVSAEAARYADLANRVQAGNDEERGRYVYYRDRFAEILTDLADDPDSPVTQDRSS